MSADLFAEFGNYSSKTSTQSEERPAASNQQSARPTDPFGPASIDKGSQVAQPAQPWFPNPNQNSQGERFGTLPSFPPSTSNGHGPTAQAAVKDDDDNDDDDGWGDFEKAQSTPEPALSRPAARLKSRASPPPVPRITRVSTFDIMTNNLVDDGSKKEPYKAPRSSLAQSSTPPVPESHPRKQMRASDPNVLFDAEDFDEYEIGDGEDEDEDEFGDFETGESLTQSQPKLEKAQPPKLDRDPVASAPSMDLLSLDDPPQPPRSTQITSHMSPPAVSPSTTPQVEKPPMQRSPEMDATNPTMAWPTFGQTSDRRSKEENQEQSKSDFKDDWGSFDDYPPEPLPEKPAVKKTAKVPAKKSRVDDTPPPQSWDWDVVESPQPTAGPKSAAPPSNKEMDDQTPPPTNIPPPSVLLSIFPQLLDLANTSLFKPLAGQPTSIKDRIASDPGTVAFLRGYLLLATVAARLIAGRKLRWHRDKFLAQGMAISAAGAKGMKLAGVDRAQAAREDREAADVVAVWREQVGRLRTAVAAANTAEGGPKGQQQLKVPEVAEKMAVTTAQFVPTAQRACVVCGLKRDERLGKVDFDVEDSFGEWWVEHWGHRACKNFWIEHEKQLRSR